MAQSTPTPKKRTSREELKKLNAKELESMLPRLITIHYEDDDWLDPDGPSIERRFYEPKLGVSISDEGRPIFRIGYADDHGFSETLFFSSEDVKEALIKMLLYIEKIGTEIRMEAAEELKEKGLLVER